MKEDSEEEVLSVLKRCVTEQVNACEDVGLLDLIYKLFAAEGVRT